MFSLAGKRLPCIMAIVPYDWLGLRTKTEHSARSYYMDADRDETGWDRLYNMYSIDEFGNKSPEMNFVMQGTFSGAFAGILWGGILKSRLEYINFIQRNDATKFTSVFEAQKKLQDTVTLSFVRGAFQWGWRLGLFTGSYILITTSISAYRGKSSLIEYTTAGFLTGSFYKLSLGPKGMFVGGLVGGFLGGIAGLLSLGILRLTGTTMEEIRYWQYNWKKNRDAQIQGTLKKARAEDTPLEKSHDLKVQPRGKELIPDTEVVESKSHDLKVQPRGKELIPDTEVVESKS